MATPIDDLRDTMFAIARAGAVAAGMKTEQPDPRDPRPGVEGFWAYHNCSRCRDGEKPCVKGGHHQCDWPHARDD